MDIVLISTYELGRQPFGLASPAAWLKARGHSVHCLDLSREPLDEQAVRAAGLIAFYVPMHTATRLAVDLIAPLTSLNPHAHLCFYGLYAPVNEDYLRKLGIGTILGGEFEEGIVSLAAKLQESPAKSNGSLARQQQPVISLNRQKFLLPDRAGLPALSTYAHVMLPNGEQRIAGATEATRGCKHLCRHCPIVPVYNGAFRVVDRDVVLADIRQQVAAGAQHISFGDPDFFNSATHGLAILQALHHEFPAVTYDVTIKIEHLRKHDAALHVLRDTGCLFVTSAVESVDDEVLKKFDKGHTRDDFLQVARRFKEVGLTLLPTFVPFNPWTTLASYNDLLEVIAEHELSENVAPIQLAIRLLIPAGSRLLELDEIRQMVGPFDPAALMFRWIHKDSRVDALGQQISELVQRGEKLKLSRSTIFGHIWSAARAAAGASGEAAASQADFRGADWPGSPFAAPFAVPFIDEPWYCCAEPTAEQFVSIGSANRGPKERAGRPDQFV